MGSTKLNLLYDVGFNREVAQDSALYWTKESGSLSELLNKTQQMTPEQIESLGKKAKQRIKDAYSWQLITEEYNRVFY